MYLYVVYFAYETDCIKTKTKWNYTKIYCIVFIVSNTIQLWTPKTKIFLYQAFITKLTINY